MNITPIQNQNYKQNAQSFKMNIKFANKVTEKAVQKNLRAWTAPPKIETELLGKDAFDFQKIWSQFQETFRTLTKSGDKDLDKSTVLVRLNTAADYSKNRTYAKIFGITEEKSKARIEFAIQDKDGHLFTNSNKELTHDWTPTIFLQDSFNDGNTPYSWGVQRILRNLSEATTLPPKKIETEKEERLRKHFSNKLFSLLRKVYATDFSTPKIEKLPSNVRDITNLCEIQGN